MDDFGMLARDFGFRPQGKSAPMAPSKPTSVGGTLNFGIGSGSADNNRSSSNKLNSSFNDRDLGDGLLFDDVFGGQRTNSSSSADIHGGKGGSSRSGDEFDSLFQSWNSKPSSMPKFDKPVYDDDIFHGLPGVTKTSSSSVKYDDVFASMSSSPPNYRSADHSAFDDLLGNLGKKETEPKSSRAKVEKDAPVFNDLLPGFGGSGTSSSKRQTSEASRYQKPSSNSTTTKVMQDPFVVLESTSSPVDSTSGLFTDPLEEISNFSSSGKMRQDSSSVNDGVFEDIDPLDSIGKSVPPVSFESKYRAKDRIPVKTAPNNSGAQSPTDEPIDKYPLETSENHTQKVSFDNFQDIGQTTFDMPNVSTDTHRSVGQTTSSPSYVNVSPTETNSQVDMSPKSEDNLKEPDDVWLTVSEIPLFTEPTSAPPPSRPPPPRPAQASKSTRPFASTNTKEKVNEFSSFPSSTQYSLSQNAASPSVGSPSTSQIDELENFAMGRSWNNVNECENVHSVEEVDTNSVAAAAMKDAMDRAEAKFRHAKEMREREHLKAAKSKEAVLNKDEDRELREKQDIFDSDMYKREKEEEEREQRRLEKEKEKEMEQRRIEKERERAREIERERQKARQAVERATREARERAAAEARLRAEKVAVEKANTEARERAERAAVQRAQAEVRERAAVQRAQAEARERAAVEARERAEKAAAEAREREAREKPSASRARAEAEAQNRAERAAVERAAAEARERAAASARERAAAAARVNEQKDDNDLESFFSMGSRPSSAPRPRANSSDPLFDTQAQSKGKPEVPRRTSAGTTSNIRKASSATNIVDDLTSIFGAAPSAGEFQEVEGESEERRRSRLERHQRTQDRAAKALAEKNERDLQAQREQAERHRISETLDAEIKRWSAGKEGNLRALLSTMQYVLWPECGWQPVSLTDLITGASVKKVYRKATLCIHPDKVQQKGANLQQKYIAEKVFDLLKEAWNKFNSEELF